MNKGTLKYILISCLIGFLYTNVIYNLDFYLNILLRLYENHLLLYPIEVSVNFYLFLFLRRHLKLKNYIIFLITVATPILIGASVLFTNTNLVPVRFPFASIFPIIGALLGILYLSNKKSTFIATILGLLLFFYITNLYILPNLYFYQLKINSSKTDPNFLNRTFYTTSNDSIKIKNIVNGKAILIECFFVGCPPCENKKKILKKIRSNYSENDLNIIFICDGSITSYSNFIKYSEENKLKGTLYLYDRNNVLSKQYNIISYPFEILASSKKIVKTLSGFDQQIEKVYYAETQKQIEKIILYSNNK